MVNGKSDRKLKHRFHKVRYAERVHYHDAVHHYDPHHPHKKKKAPKKQAFLAILICVLALGGFFLKEQELGLFSVGTMLHPQVKDSRSKEEARTDFEEQIDKIFKEEVTDDSITLNYTLKNPENYGISEDKPTLGTYSLESLKSSLLVSENRIAMLETFDFDKLTEEQQLIYDIVYKMSKQNLEAAELLEYSETLAPATGIQAQLPVFFAEYNFYQKKDVENYIALLKQVPDYFTSIIEFEKQKSEKGLFMSDITAQAIIEQCKEFIENPEKNYMITIFDKKIAAVDGLTDKEKTDFTGQNKQAVLESVVPAYQKLIDGLTALKGTGKNDGGLCHLKHGKKYYEYLVKVKTGSDRSVEKMDSLLDDKISGYKKDMSELMTKYPSAYYDAQSVTYQYDTPQKSFDRLRECAQKDFPVIPEEISCELKTVDASLENSMSPAFYLVPAIDDYQNNVIYINGSDKYDLSKAFTTIAHEGYPGHLYQNCYFRSTEPSPLRLMFHVGGYTEGWGIYAEIYGYDKAGLDKNVAKLLKLNTLLTLCIYAKTDIGIHEKGWTYKETQTFLSDYGFSKTNARSIFDAIVADPADYTQYTIGYLEIENLREKAKEALGEKYEDKKFYEFFLSIGPAPFAVIENRMETWLKK